MPFACPGCDSPIEGSPARLAQRCPACGVVVRSRALETSGSEPEFEVQVAGRPETRRRVSVSWDEPQRRRLAAWLLWSTVATLSLVLVLYVLARLAG